MLIHPADVISEIEEAAKFQITVSTPTIDRHALVTRVCKLIDAESASIAPLLANTPNVTVYRGACEFTGTHTVKVGDVEITATKIFVVSGCQAAIPNIPGLKGTPYLTYKEALRQTDTPNSMIIIGGGYIAVELGYYYGKTGTKVDFLVRSTMLKGLDNDIRDFFQTEFLKTFPVHFGVSPIAVKHDGKQFHVTVRLPDGTEKVMISDALMVATGVESTAPGLKMAEVGYALRDDGFISIDSSFRTNIANVWAFGDVVGHPMFRHAANYQGEWVFRSVFEDVKLQTAGIKYPPMPQAVFTNPQIASVGLTEHEAREFHSAERVIVGNSKYENTAMGDAILSPGRVKLVFAGKDLKLVGAHVVGKEASDLIHMMIAYMRCGANLDILMDTIFIHPALAEVLRNAARNANSQR